MTKTFHVIKRDGRKELFDADKVNKVVQWATEDVNGVSPSDIIMSSHLQLHDNVKTEDIHQVLINSANSMITEDAPNYQYVAARLALFDLRKKVYGDYEPVCLLDHIRNCIDSSVYDPEILEWFTEDEISRCERYVRHQRDLRFTYAGLRQMIDKYLIRDRKTDVIYETPQYAFIMIAMTLFHEYDNNVRFRYIKEFYNAISNFKINLPTPIIAGVRTPIRQYSSCVLIDVDDTLDSILSSTAAIGYYTARRAGIGLNVGRIRPIGSIIRHGEVVSTGLIPFLKLFEASVKCTSQNGIRGGSATTYVPFWHLEIEDVVVLKNNRGTEDNRVRKLDYAVQLSRLFYDRFIKNEDITLFDPSEVPELYDAFGTPEFDEMYESYERRWSLTTKKVSARDLMLQIAKERVETGRIYVMNIDNMNSHSSFKSKINMSNLCTEISLPVTPIDHIDDDNGEIAICVLGGINVGTAQLDEFESLADLLVRALDYIIDNQDYPVKAAEKEKKRRSIGIGITNFAYWLAKNGLKYTDDDTLAAVDELMEKFQYSLLKASNNLAIEKGPCEYFQDTKYADGVFPIDTYSKKLDELCDRELTCDWADLRESVAEYGLRNSTLSAIMPAESSAVVSSATNGVEPVRSLLTVKKSKQGLLRMIVPEFYTLRNKYELAFDIRDNRKLLNVLAVIQKHIDQAMSVNTYYAYSNYDDGNLPLSEVIRDLMHAYSIGIKNLYYHNNDDGNRQFDKEEPSFVEVPEELGCAGGACSI